MEVSSPPTNFDHLSDSAFLLGSGTDPASLPYFPALLLPLHRITGGGILPAVLLGAIADALSGVALYQLAVQLNLSRKYALDVATMFLWNPLTIASCISGSADPLRLTALFLAAAAAAAGRSGVAGAGLAVALHFSSSSSPFSFFSSPVMLMAIPFIALSVRNQHQQQKKNGNKNTRNKNTTAVAATSKATSITTTMMVTVFFLIGFLVASSMLTLTSHYLISSTSPITLHSTGQHRTIQLTWLEKIFKNKNFEIITQLGSLFSVDLRKQQQRVDDHPWSNIEPNLGLQWYLFSEVLPPFRYLYEYVFWAVSTGLCFSIALRFSQKNPIAVVVGQGIVLCMLCHHPTYSDIMLWLALMPLVLLMEKQGQGEEKRKKKKQHDGGEGHGQGDHTMKRAVRMWLAVGFCVTLGLNTAAYELWLTLGTGNANFFYGMNLIWAAWQAFALVLLLKSTATMEADNAAA